MRYDKRINCLPILVGFPAPGALCEAAHCGVAGPAGLCPNSLEATLADWLSGRGCGPGLPLSRDQMTVYMCRALLGGEQRFPAGPEVPSFANTSIERPPFSCGERAGSLDLLERCPHGQPTASFELGCGQIAVPIAGVIDLLR
jgi:hypothetical protein